MTRCRNWLLTIGFLTFSHVCYCGAVQTFGLSSQNVVGYTTPDLGANANLSASPFVTVGDSGMDIQQIKPESANIYGGAVSLKLLTDVLADDVEYFYLPADEAPDGVTAGWYEGDYATLASKTFGAGEGFIIVNSVDDTSVTYSGEVTVGRVTWEIAPNANFAGNVTPIDLDIQDVKLGTAVDAEGNLTDELGEIYGGAISIKLLTDVLGDDVEYFYLPAAEAPDGVTAGWYENDYATLVSRTFVPSEGFIIVSGITAGFAQIPAALTAD